MSNTREPTEGFAFWPTDELDAGEAFGFGECEEILESEFWENCGYKP